jgi:hypothetical protein
MIYVECKPDFLLVNTLGFSKKDIVHAGNISKVCKGLAKSENAKGLVDEDPDGDRPTYIDTLQLLQNQHEIKLLRDDKRDNQVIVLCPRLEEWLIKVTEEAGVDIGRYGLPNDGEKLHKVINLDLRKFEKLVNDLKDKSKMLKALKKALMEQG